LFNIVHHRLSSVFRLTLQTHAPHSGTPTSEQDVVYLAMAISATELQKAVQGFVQDSASFVCLFKIFNTHMAMDQYLLIPFLMG